VTPQSSVDNSPLSAALRWAEVTVDNFGSYARVPTLVAQRLRSETYESPALPLSYSATDFVLRSTRGLSNEHPPRIPTVDNSGNSVSTAVKESITVRDARPASSSRTEHNAPEADDSAKPMPDVSRVRLSGRDSLTAPSLVSQPLPCRRTWPSRLTQKSRIGSSSQYPSALGSAKVVGLR
jgi:hypothetical protein